MSDPLRTVLVRRPDEAFGAADPKQWGYTAKPNLVAAQREHGRLIDMLKQSRVDVRYHEDPQPGKADSIFVHDPAIVTDRGAVILRMGKKLRRGEEESMARTFQALHVPILARLHGDATAEGGDLLWVNHDLLAVGQGFRTNAGGLSQIRETMTGIGVAVEAVPLPYFQGPDTCLHLMSLISVIDDDLAVIYPRLFPVPFWKSLREHGFEFVEVPDEEFNTMAPNVLAVGPRDCIVLEGNPITRKRLEASGCRVRTYRGKEISLKAEGGATCLTRPVLRSK
ncbi:MAG TPA: arginine deiminase family protein [Thermoplasmata archaeon]|nr:arginine deiminase family protein [Thermoplasmata archaeon]